MKKIYTYLIFSFALLCSTSLIAQTNEKARETAVMIADRILKSTTYDFVDKKSGKTYTSLKNVPLNKNVKVQSKYLDWHYTNGVTNIALMELGDKLGTSKYENYVLKNMNFIFDDANQDYFHRLYDQTLEQEGWRAVNHVNWHMIYRNKRLDDNGPMGASLIVLNRRHPEQAFQKYIDQTDHHRWCPNLVLPMALLPGYGRMSIPFGPMMPLWLFLFWSGWERRQVMLNILMMQPIRY